MTVIQAIYCEMTRIDNCEKMIRQEKSYATDERIAGIQENIDNAESILRRIERNYLPHGSGFDSGTEILSLEKRKNRIVFKSSYHHMDETGCYGNWSEFRVIVVPTFDSIELDVKMIGKYGGKRGDRSIDVDYWIDCFYSALTEKYKAG